MAETRLGIDAYREATDRGTAEREAGPVPVSVRYDAASRRIVLEFSNGAAFMVPAHSLQNLDMASDEDLADVELLGETGLHWERLDVDFRISGLMAGIFGTAAFMDRPRRGGPSQASVERAASPAGEAKGLRPRTAG